MRIDLFYMDDCPSWQSALENLKFALEAEGIVAEVCPVRVENDDEADRLKFLGSPSFSVQGVDFWPEDRNRYHLSCRVYSTSQGMKGFPTMEMLREKIHALAVHQISSLPA